MVFSFIKNINKIHYLVREISELIPNIVKHNF